MTELFIGKDPIEKTFLSIHIGDIPHALDTVFEAWANFIMYGSNSYSYLESMLKPKYNLPKLNLSITKDKNTHFCVPKTRNFKPYKELNTHKKLISIKIENLFSNE